MSATIFLIIEPARPNRRNNYAIKASVFLLCVNFDILRSFVDTGFSVKHDDGKSGCDEVKMHQKRHHVIQ